jgi:signal transduction histidine kinase
VTLQRRSLRIDDLDREARFHDSPERFSGRMRSLVSAPLLFRDECLGVLNFWCHRPHAYLDSDLELIELIAGHISAAIQSARRVEREQRLVEELREVNRIQDEFLAVATHDLRNALQGVLAYIGILAVRAGDDPVLAELVANLASASSGMKTLITDLHDLARLGMRAIRLHPTRLDLKKLALSVLDQHAEFAREEEVHLARPEQEPSLFLEADPVRLRQVLSNLVSNAIKYNRPGGRVEVCWRQEDQEAVLEVRDNGVGIKPEHQEAIFDLFRRVASSSRKAEGSGLGLTITRQLVDLHGGRIELNSEVDRGSLFRVRLPLHRIPEQERAILEPLPLLPRPGA